MDRLKTCTIDELLSDPEWIMDKHFLRGGLPDRTKTTIVVGVPCRGAVNIVQVLSA